jgi:hypothetical protein
MRTIMAGPAEFECGLIREWDGSVKTFSSSRPIVARKSRAARPDQRYPSNGVDLD